MHLQEEAHHSDWFTNAVRKTATSLEDLEQVTIGARETADAWHMFWIGVGAHVQSSTSKVQS